MENFNSLYTWCITDGNAGNVNQAKGLAQILGLDFKQKEIYLNFPWNKLPVGFIPINKYAFKNLDEFNLSSIPNIIITCGKRSAYISIYLKRKYPYIFNIHILNPKIDKSYFDLIVTPSHDKLSGENILSTEIALSHINESMINEEKLKFEKEFKSERRKICTILIGGNSRNHKFEEKEAQKLASKINNLAKNNKFKIIVLYSRRTSNKIKTIIKSELTQKELIWDKNENPYISLMGYSDFIICTSDSVSMISESISSKKPVFIYKLPSRKINNRIENFINTVLAKNYAKLLENDLYDFDSKYNNQNEKIKKIIINKFQRYMNMNRNAEKKNR